ncbi:hypothetical protein G6F36_012488 [Rhizopus arrhizus]|nr:hypothetical protein G6F36_012488 [Rhizopus arrhizus]
METLLNDFKGLDLKTKLLEMHHHLGEASIATEASTMDTEEEADHEVDLGVGIGHTVNLFRQEEEAEQIIQQHPSSPVISTKQQQQTQQVVQYHNKNSTSNQHYAVPQDGILPGGRLTHFYNYWTQITSHQCPLSIVKEGYKIQFASHPTPWKLKSSNINPADQQAVNEAVNKFLSAGIIEIMPTQSEKYLSKFFTIQESTKRRSILDCQRLSQYIQCEYLKMEGTLALSELIEKGDFMWIPIQPKENEDYSAFTQDQQSSTEDQTSITANQEFLQMDCSSTREGCINDLSDRRSASPYSSPATRFSKELTIEQPELGKTLPDISTKSTSVSMVEKIDSNEERPTNSVYETTNTTDHNLHRQLRLGLGSELTNDQSVWLLEQETSIDVRELKAVYFALKMHAKKIRKLYNKGFHRQRDSIEIHNMILGNSFTPTTEISRDDSGHLQQIQFEGNLSAYTGIKSTNADRLSKQLLSFFEWTIPKKRFQQILQQWGPLSIDTFAAPHNHQLKKY